jgi:hypothetical protein
LRGQLLCVRLRLITTDIGNYDLTKQYTFPISIAAKQDAA